MIRAASLVLSVASLANGMFWPGGFNPFRMLQGDFGPFDPYGNMQRMRSVNLDNIPAGSEKVVRDQNGEGVYFKSPDGNSGGFAFTSGGGPGGFVMNSGFTGGAPNTGFVMTAGSGQPPRIYEFGNMPKGERRHFRDGNSQGTVFRSADGSSGGFTFTSGNGNAFAMGGASSGTGPEGVSGGADYSGGSRPETGTGSFAFSSSHAGSVPKKVWRPARFKSRNFLKNFLSVFEHLSGYKFKP
ncbi:serine/threonine-protein phosphatase 1 regulatory subunit 10-like isoform X1 [Crassostrea angulata]|uniref:serine/threonine-protein phosphatase 1 regulatory subunit 10-like isoform X1 n=1 Tax=Magallana angulata TaxID=2784310 RepID=UPI0022B157A7|nr:serine/threonine-protein phosphatase 1 regulatory subunit 10-like isoform X1 [Crassostrea angulata]XP_052705476.1 serine/threonine-protein phosphatase 1 regulatory subunit 10-like isoform X1 [Crassostrea angulata]